MMMIEISFSNFQLALLNETPSVCTIHLFWSIIKVCILILFEVSFFSYFFGFSTIHYHPKYLGIHQSNLTTPCVLEAHMFAVCLLSLVPSQAVNALMELVVVVTHSLLSFAATPREL